MTNYRHTNVTQHEWLWRNEDTNELRHIISIDFDTSNDTSIEFGITEAFGDERKQMYLSINRENLEAFRDMLNAALNKCDQVLEVPPAIGKDGQLIPW